jgi:hypothetical protein
MSFLVPFGFALLAVPLAILLVHVLWDGRRRVRVPAIFLWEGLSPRLSGRARVRRPPLSLLLLLQLLAAAIPALALARPATPVQPPPKHIAVVLDASGSMQATDVAPSRFEAARAAALERLSELHPHDTVSIVRAGLRATLVAGGTPDDARVALAAVHPGAGAGALRDGIALALQQVAATPGRPGRVIVFTDAAFPELGALGTVAAPVEFVSIAPAGVDDNQAIVATRVQPGISGDQQAFVEVVNYDDRPARRRLRISDAEQEREFESRSIQLPAGAAVGLVVQLPGDVTRVTLQLDGDDALALDDVVEVIAPAIGRRSSSVTLVSDAPVALRRVLEVVPAIKLHVVGSDAYDRALPPSAAPGSGNAQLLTILHGVLPDRLPDGPLLIVNPPATSAHLDVTGAATAVVPTTFDADHPLLASVDAAALRFDETRVIEPPSWATPVVAAARGPLILDGLRDGRPVVIFAFDPAQAGLETSLAFPLLLSNAIIHLLEEAQGPAITPGDVLTLPAPDGGRAVLVSPDGQRRQLSADDSELRVRDTDQVGRYTILDAQDERVLLRSFTVNLLDATESDIRPRQDLAPMPVTTAERASSTGDSGAPLREWWRWLVAATLALLVLEWLVFARRGYRTRER